METKILFFLALLCVVLAIFLINTYIRLKNTRKSYERSKTIVEFLLSLMSIGGPSLGRLVSLDIDILRGLEPQLLEYYRRKFFKLVTKSAIEEIEPYIKSINELPESPQKEFIKNTLKKEIFSEKAVNLVDIIFRVVKLNNTENSNAGSILRNFLFDDVSYLSKKNNYLTNIIIQCKLSLEKIAVDDKVKQLMINDFDSLILKIN